MIEPFAIGWFVLSALSLWLALHAKQKWVRIGGHVAFFVLALAMLNHWLPGIHNPIVYDKVLLSPDAVPFSLYLNFDKTWVALLIFVLLLRKQDQSVLRSDFVFAAKVLAGLVAVLWPLALLSHYVHWDPKFPVETWVWAANNLLLVCTAEEGFFRGYIQGGLARRGKWPAILVSAVLFGLLHWRGGPIFVAFATIAGIAYGMVYWRTKKIVFPIAIHFLFNTIHFLLFTYPALSR